MFVVIPPTPRAASDEPTVVLAYSNEPSGDEQPPYAPRGRSLSRSPSRASIATRSRSPDSVRGVPIVGGPPFIGFPAGFATQPPPPVIILGTPSVHSLSPRRRERSRSSSRSSSRRSRSLSPVPVSIPSSLYWSGQGPAMGVPAGPPVILLDSPGIPVSRPSTIIVQPIVQPLPTMVYPPSASGSPVLLAYRFESELAYVPAGQTYDEALGYVVDVFPALASVARDRIAFSIAARRGKMVRVPRCAWTAVLRGLKKYEVVDIKVGPEPGAPPEYPADGKASMKTNGKTKERGSWLARLFGRE